jgi:hypothetical protein
MKSKNLIFISIGVALGLYIGTHTDFEKNNLLQMMNRIESCVRVEFPDSGTVETEDRCYKKEIFPINMKNNN